MLALQSANPFPLWSKAKLAVHSGEGTRVWHLREEVIPLRLGSQRNFLQEVVQIETDHLSLWLDGRAGVFLRKILGLRGHPNLTALRAVYPGDHPSQLCSLTWLPFGEIQENTGPCNPVLPVPCPLLHPLGVPFKI